VVDAAGTPAPGVQVVLWVGNATAVEIRRTVDPFAQMDGYGMVVITPTTPVALAKTATDAAGHWTLWAVRETSESFAVGNPLCSLRPDSWSVVAMTHEGLVGTVHDLRVAATEKSVDCTIRLDAEVKPADAP
jgi:hypothetical protein